MKFVSISVLLFGLIIMAKEQVLTKSVTDIIVSWKHNIVDVVSHSVALFSKKIENTIYSHVKVMESLWMCIPMVELLTF